MYHYSDTPEVHELPQFIQLVVYIAITSWFKPSCFGYVSLIVSSLVLIMWLRWLWVEGAYGLHDLPLSDRASYVGLVLFVIMEGVLFGAVSCPIVGNLLIVDGSIVTCPDSKLHMTAPGYYRIIVDCFTWDNTMALLGSDLLFWSGVVTVIVVVYWSELLSGSRQLLLLVSILALAFTNTLAVEFIHSYWTMGSCDTGFTYYVLTGLHGSHCLLGWVALSLMFVGSSSSGFLYNYSSTCCSGTLGLFMYWHLVDLVWVLLLLYIYCSGPVALITSQHRA
jgi:heme/copper-type cytochrome/quinol oxidase subunit 3